jgi:hypothetical protein
MKKKIVNKSLKYLAISIFIFAMVANIQLTLNDPFIFTSELVLAQETDNSTEESCDVGGPGSSSCSYESCSVGFCEKCSVTCTDGYYACCGYDSLSADVYCKCVEDSNSSS